MKLVRANLPGLHAVRGCAALIVLVHHIEQAKHIVGWPTIFEWPVCNNAGFMGVDLFFVLSGFLITYLLMKEHDVRGTVAIGKFYLRRIARIWPVYFAVVIASSLVLIHVDFLHFPPVNPPRDAGAVDRGLFFYLLMCPQFVPVGTPALAFATVLWSVGVEEHFYAVWPHLVRRAHRIFPWVAGVLVVAVAAARATNHFLPDAAITNSRFDCMGIGGVAAWVALYSPRLVMLFQRRAVVVVMSLSVVWLAVTTAPFGPIDHDLFSVLAAALILRLATGKKTALDRPWVIWVGELSYGLYAFQWLCIVVAVNTLRATSLTASANAAALYPFAIALTIVVAYASYRFLEQPALRVRRAFSALPDEQIAATTTASAGSAEGSMPAGRESPPVRNEGAQ